MPRVNSGWKIIPHSLKTRKTTKRTKDKFLKCHHQLNKDVPVISKPQHRMSVKCNAIWTNIRKYFEASSDIKHDSHVLKVQCSERPIKRFVMSLKCRGASGQGRRREYPQRFNFTLPNSSGGKIEGEMFSPFCCLLPCLIAEQSC